MTLPTENLAQLNQWITENVASLTAALQTARTAWDTQQVEQSASRFLQALQTKDRATAAALEAIRQEIAAHRPDFQASAEGRKR